MPYNSDYNGNGKSLMNKTMKFVNQMTSNHKTNGLIKSLKKKAAGKMAQPTYMNPYREELLKKSMKY